MQGLNDFGLLSYDSVPISKNPAADKEIQRNIEKISKGNKVFIAWLGIIRFETLVLPICEMQGICNLHLRTFFVFAEPFQAAKLAEITERAYQRYEAGTVFPDVRIAKKIAKALNCLIEDIF